MVSGLSGIYEIPKLFVGHHDYRGTRLLEADVSCVVYDSTAGRIFYFDDSEKAIKVIQSEATQLLYSPVNIVEDMAHDTSSCNIYWTTAQV